MIRIARVIVHSRDIPIPVNAEGDGSLTVALACTRSLEGGEGGLVVVPNSCPFLLRGRPYGEKQARAKNIGSYNSPPDGARVPFRAKQQ